MVRNLWAPQNLDHSLAMDTRRTREELYLQTRVLPLLFLVLPNALILPCVKPINPIEAKILRNYLKHKDTS